MEVLEFSADPLHPPRESLSRDLGDGVDLGLSS